MPISLVTDEDGGIYPLPSYEDLASFRTGSYALPRVTKFRRLSGRWISGYSVRLRREMEMGGESCEGKDGMQVGSFESRERKFSKQRRFSKAS